MPRRIYEEVLIKSKPAPVRGRRRCRRCLFAFTVLLFGFLLVGANQVRIQWLQREAIVFKARKAGILVTEQSLYARRGTIISSDGKVLARDGDVFRLGINPYNVPLSPAFCYDLSMATGIPAAEIHDMISQRPPLGELEVDLSEAQKQRVVKLVQRYHADGVWVRPALGREYPLGWVTAPLLGWVKEGKGFAGIERSANEALSGVHGLRVGVVDREGRFVSWLVDGFQSRGVEDGKDIELTVNAEIQQWAMQALFAQCERHQPASGVAIVMDPKTGDILALATYPSFDPTDVISASWQTVRGGRSVAPDINPAVAHRLEPGSLFKAFTIALALDQKVISEQEVVKCGGKIPVGKHVIHCTGDHAPKVHSVVNPARCIEVSCNVTAATWGMKLGFDRLARMVEALGLLEKPEVGLPGEVPGDLNYNEVNKTLQCANIGFGQSINVTPVSLASAFAVFANEGKLVRPRLIKRIGDQEIPPSIGPQVFAPETARKVLKMMELVIHGKEGTGRSLKIPRYHLAGKSGTAQTPDPRTGSLRSGLHVSSFVGYVPADNPKAVILVMLNKPRSGQYYGAVVAGPVFQNIARFLIQYWNLPPSEDGDHAP